MDDLDDSGKNHLRRVCEAAKGMDRLITDLLELSRVSRGAMQRESVSLTDIGHKVLGALHESEPDRVVNTVIEADLRAEGDPVLLRQMLENLLGNAWKYSSKRETATVELGVSVQNGRRVFHVKDNGTGFDMAHAGKLFGPFQRLHDTSEFSGTGIGLSIVQRIVQRHGGRVWVEAEVDKGATFFFTLGQEERSEGGD